MHHAMPAFIANGPFWGILLFMFFVVFHRAQITYGLGRLVAAGVLRKRANKAWAIKIQNWFDGPIPKKGEQALEKWGLIIIPLCFLTIGFQTAVNAGAGLVRMRWLTYTLFMIPGCIAWAIVYSTIGMSIWWVILKLSMSNPLIAGPIFVIVVVALTFLLIKKARASH